MFPQAKCTRRQLVWVASKIETDKATRTKKKKKVTKGRQLLAEFQATIGIMVKLWAIIGEILSSQAV